jgi:hypothetical protein
MRLEEFNVSVMVLFDVFFGSSVIHRPRVHAVRPEIAAIVLNQSFMYEVLPLETMITLDDTFSYELASYSSVLVIGIIVFN